jgi:phage tail-like protein
MTDARTEMVDSPFTSFRFQIDIQLNQQTPELTSPLCSGAFAECDGLEVTMEPKTVESGGVNSQQIHLAGPVRYGQLSLRRGMTTNLQLWSWFTLASQPGRDPTAHVDVTLWDAYGEPVVIFSLDNCLPVRMRAPSLNARDGLVAIEELGIVYGKLGVRPARTSASGGTATSAAGGPSAPPPPVSGGTGLNPPAPLNYPLNGVVD